MPRLHGYRERQHQPIWDSIVRTTGTPDPQIASQVQLFNNRNIGDLAKTNMEAAGQLASDQTYVILAMRCWLYFEGPSARVFYQQVASQLYFSLIMGKKGQFEAPCWYYPAGGGIVGFDPDTALFNHGVASQEAILKLARPIIVPVRQNISVVGSFFPVGTTDVRDTLNAPQTNDQMVILFMLDGMLTRDVL